MYSHTRTLCLCAEPFIFVLVLRIWIKSSIIAHILLIFIYIFFFWFGGILCCCLKKESFILRVHNFLIFFIARIMNCRNYDHHSMLHLEVCVAQVNGHFNLPFNCLNTVCTNNINWIQLKGNFCVCTNLSNRFTYTTAIPTYGFVDIVHIQ